MRNKIIRIIIYLTAVIIIRANHHFENYTANQSLQRFFVVLELIFAILAVWTALSIMKKPLKVLYERGKAALQKRFAAIAAKIKEKYNLNRKYIKGTDENKYIWNFNLGLKDKFNNFRLRQKINLKRSSSNIEKIRLLYIKFILILADKKYAVRYSHTPNEIKNNLDFESDILFDAYEKIRYNNESDISDDTVKSCERFLSSGDISAVNHRDKR